MSQIQKNKDKNKTTKSEFMNNYEKYKNYIYSGAFLVIFLVLFISNNNGSETKEGPYPPYYSAGEVLKLSDLQGKVVILDFWATWCPPCRKGIPDLVQLKKDYKAKGVEVIGVSLDALTRGGATFKDVSPFIKEYKINYPILNGTEDVITKFGGINSIPTSFVIDKEGYIIASYVGLVEKANYEADIKKALVGKYDKKTLRKAPLFTLNVLK